MADGNNGSGFVGGIAANVKPETRHIDTNARWEDIGRIRAQTWNMAGLRMWQIAALLFTALAWAYTWSVYRKAESVPSNDLTNIINVILVISSLLIFAVLVVDIRRDVVDSSAQWIVIAVLTLIEIGIVFSFVPVATWAIMNMFALGYVPLLQIIAAGWIPIALSIVSMSIVPDFQIGRFAWWRELTNQPAASSEKQVLDVTAIELKRMELDAKHDEMIDAERAEYEDRIAELEAKIERLVNTKATHHLIPHNHGSARGFASIEYTEPEWDSLKAFVTGWDNRGTARDNWTTREAEQKHGSRIPEPHWEKIVADLKAVGVLNERGKPSMKADEAAQVIGL